MGGVIIEEKIINETMPLFLSVILLLMIRHFVAGMTWMTVTLFNVLIISVTMFYYTKAGWIGHDAISVVIGESDPYVNISGRGINHIRAVAVLMMIVMTIAFISSIAIIRCILVATSILKVAAKVIGEVPALIILLYFMLAIFFMFWLPVALHLFSSSQILRNDGNANCRSYDLKSNRVNCDNCCGYNVHCTFHISIFILFSPIWMLLGNAVHHCMLFNCYCWISCLLLLCTICILHVGHSSQI